MDYQRTAIFLIGNATADAKVKEAKESGNPYGDFRLAVRQRDGQTVFYPVRCFGRLAGGLSGIKKGTRVFVDGELEIASFTETDGDRQMTFRVVANTYRILDAGRSSETADEATLSSEVPSLE